MLSGGVQDGPGPEDGIHEPVETPEPVIFIESFKIIYTVEALG
jgi:hypothetical protein